MLYLHLNRTNQIRQIFHAKKKIKFLHEIFYVFDLFFSSVDAALHEIFNIFGLFYSSLNMALWYLPLNLSRTNLKTFRVGWVRYLEQDGEGYDSCILKIENFLHEIFDAFNLFYSNVNVALETPWIRQFQLKNEIKWRKSPSNYLLPVTWTEVAINRFPVVINLSALFVAGSRIDSRESATCQFARLFYFPLHFCRNQLPAIWFGLTLFFLSSSFTSRIFFSLVSTTWNNITWQQASLRG